MQVPIPDLLPQQVPGINGLLSMVAGDFVEVYGQEGYSSTFDAVATCFFLDTAHNLFEYIDVIWNVLKVCGSQCVHAELHGGRSGPACGRTSLQHWLATQQTLEQILCVPGIYI